MIIALVLSKRHAGAAVEKFAKTLDVLLRNVDGTSSENSEPPFQS